eukprot:3060345-Lingulodinium_polyedra.AAC.1
MGSSCRSRILSVRAPVPRNGASQFRSAGRVRGPADARPIAGGVGRGVVSGGRGLQRILREASARGK